MTKGSIRWAPYPGGPQQCRTLAAPGRYSTVLVCWQTGPGKGREARIPTGGLRQHKRDVPCLEFCDDLMCLKHGLLS